MTNGAFVIVVVLTFLCFLPDLKNELLDWDDAGYILENTHIQSLSFETLRWAFSEFYLNYWAPLTWVSLSLDYAVWGKNPIGYHLTNNIIHATNSGFFFLLCRELLKPRQSGAVPGMQPALGYSDGVITVCSMLASIFYATHPLRVESVAWATERKDVLALFFGLPTALFYLWHARATDCMRVASNQENYWKVSPHYLLSLAFFALSLLCKSLMVTLPAVMLVLDWFPLERLKVKNIPTLLLEKAPFFLLSGLVSMLTMKATLKVAITFDQIDLFTCTLNAFKSILEYLKLTVWPFNVSPFYVHPFAIPNVTLEYALPLVFFALTTFSCVLLMKRIPVLMAAWLIYLIALLPFLGFTQVGAQAMAGRFTYFAGLPLALLVAIGVVTIYQKYAGSRFKIIMLCASVTVILLGNVFLTVRDISFWKDDVTLWTRVIDLAPHTSGRAYFQRSNAYRIKGDFHRSLIDINEAITIAAQKKYNAMHELYRVRAGIFLDIGNMNSAVDNYTKALETATAGSRAMILYERGVLYQKIGRFDLAAEDLRLSNMTERAR